MIEKLQVSLGSSDRRARKKINEIIDYLNKQESKTIDKQKPTTKEIYEDLSDGRCWSCGSMSSNCIC